MNEISYSDFLKILSSKDTKSAFLCGNGFSMNFDSDFTNIYDRLESSHKQLLRNIELDVKANGTFKRKLIDNYKEVSKWLRYKNQKDFIEIFEDGVKFAESILCNDSLLQELQENKKISTLVFGLSNIDLVKMIYENDSKYGIKGVNVEHWTILIYFYYAINELDTNCYNYPADNSFITTIRVGDINKSAINGLTDASTMTIFNGFSTYYRILFTVAIFTNGKSINLKDLNNVSNLNIKQITSFLNRFAQLITLNYDHILELLTNRDVDHLHGKFIIDRKRFVYNQSYSIKHLSHTVEFSDVLVGDYFIFKSFLAIINKMASTVGINVELESYENILKRIISTNSINTFLLFGMNIENDYHILRNLMLELYSAHIQNPIIVYAYYDDIQKDIFIEQYDKLITFDEKASEYSRNISVYFLKTKEVLKNVFLK